MRWEEKQWKRLSDIITQWRLETGHTIFKGAYRVECSIFLYFSLFFFQTFSAPSTLSTGDKNRPAMADLTISARSVTRSFEEGFKTHTPMVQDYKFATVISVGVAAETSNCYMMNGTAIDAANGSPPMKSFKKKKIDVAL